MRIGRRAGLWLAVIMSQVHRAKIERLLEAGHRKMQLISFDQGVAINANHLALLRVVKQEPCDVVVTDPRMEGNGGMEILTGIREGAFEIPSLHSRSGTLHACIEKR